MKAVLLPAILRVGLVVIVVVLDRFVCVAAAAELELPGSAGVADF